MKKKPSSLKTLVGVLLALVAVVMTVMKMQETPQKQNQSKTIEQEKVVKTPHTRSKPISPEEGIVVVEYSTKAFLKQTENQ